VKKYSAIVDSESAYEILNSKLNEASVKTQQIEEEKQQAKKEKSEPGFFDNPVVKQVGRTAASVITRSLLGALGLGGRSGKRSLF
ncbi:MAG: ATPase, partial [Bacteroidota bacterium]